ncbi:hypothetical protein PSPO01_16510 [Paraphaeosphaeria sporulosa]
MFSTYAAVSSYFVRALPYPQGRHTHLRCRLGMLHVDKIIRRLSYRPPALTRYLDHLATSSFRHNVSVALRAIARRTFFGSCATLTSSVVNITILMALQGEPGWICMICCNADSEFPSPFLAHPLFRPRTPLGLLSRQPHLPKWCPHPPSHRPPVPLS